MPPPIRFLLRFFTLTLLEHPCPESMPDDHSKLWATTDDCAEQDDRKMPAGDGGGDKAKDVEEDAEIGMRGVHVVCEAVKYSTYEG